MHSETVYYTDGETEFKGHLVYSPDTESRRPAVIVAHAWKGQDDFTREKAQTLAELGYVAFATDVYGNGKTVTTKEEATALMLPLFLDRKLLQKRIMAGYKTLIKNRLVDTKRIGGIGFCFGGLTIIELFRTGVDLRGVVSFHGLLGTEKEGKKAQTTPMAKGIEGSVLVLHGHDDPLVSQSDILNFQKEYTEAKIDWQMNIYGQTSHAFTNPAANDPKMGMIYSPRSALRAWEAMETFFDEVFL